MLTKADVATPEVIEGWLNDLAIATTRRADPASNWMVEFAVPGSMPLVLHAANPKAMPRSVMLVCGMMVAPEHEAAFQTFNQEQRRGFWRGLRSILSREFVEWQVEGVITECPKSVRVTAVRFDDGLTLDSFGRTLSSVCKACSDAGVYFTENLGETTTPAGGEFAFKKTGTQ